MYKLKNYFGEWYTAHDSMVLRNPLFPVDVFFKWKSSPNAEVKIAKEELRKSLREFFSQAVTQEALYIGSPDLHEQLLLWLSDKIEKADKKDKTELSLVKYMTRMCTRSTPYGLFASCTYGTLSDKTAIQLADKEHIQRHGRLDMDYIGEFLSHLLKQKEITNQLLFYPNSSMYALGDQWRYIEHRFLEQTGRSYHLVQVAQSVYLEKIFNAARQGRTTGELSSLITDDEISYEEANEFIHELINNQLLVSELEPNVTGEEYFMILVSRLKKLQHTERFSEQLEKVLDEFRKIKDPDAEGRNAHYPKIVEHLKELEITLHLKTLIQVDSYRPASVCTLNRKISDEILKGASLLQVLAADDSLNDRFADFKNAFMNRYESQWVPLVEVLDTESGIGYGKFAATGMEESPLIDKLPIGNGAAAATRQQVQDVETFKWKLYQEAIEGKQNKVEISDELLEQFPKKEFKEAGCADSVYSMIKINAHSASDIDAGNYTMSFNPPSGPSGANLLGRFCQLHPEISAFAQKILIEEESHLPECVYAEIVHLPESRIGNILMRPVLREYEIPYLCGTTLDKDFQIPVTDLMVGVENGNVVLRSTRLNKRVIPRMTTAHNFSMTSLPIYHFLCELQYQNVRSVGWNWGILDNRPFLPRVSYGKFIYSKARWVIAKEEIKGMEKLEDEKLVPEFDKLIAKLNLPEYVLLSQGDNELLLHLKNIYCLNLLISEINKSGVVILTEFLDTPDQCWMESPDGRHAGEFLLAFTRNVTVAEKPGSPAVIKKEIKSDTTRYFPVGSEWLYAKIYCGTKTAEKILAEIIKPLTEQLLEEKIIDKYFFIRYHDTGNHLRIRFHNAADKNFWQEVIDRIHKALLPLENDHLVHNIQFETYQREVERYGYETMEQCEIIFYYQSVAVLNFISMLEGDEGEQFRWQAAMKAIDLFLSHFHYTLEQKRDLLKVLHDNFAREFSISAPQQKKISERFSTKKQLIRNVIGDGDGIDGNFKYAMGMFNLSDPGYLQAIEDILDTSLIREEPARLNELMASLLHMYINRIFISNQRKAELVIYDYLHKTYETEIAISKNKKAGKEEKVITG